MEKLGFMEDNHKNNINHEAILSFIYGLSMVTFLKESTLECVRVRFVNFLVEQHLEKKTGIYHSHTTHFFSQFRIFTIFFSFIW